MTATKKTINTLITPEQLNGTWLYSCEMMLPGSSFPDEYIANNKGLIANKHGGEVTFKMIDSDNVEVKGTRMWREIKGTVHHENLEKGIEWKSIYGVTFKDNQLLYQYRIIGVQGINGITNVTYIEHNNGMRKMEGWFYYVPDRQLLDALTRMEDINTTMTAGKQFGVEWLKLFGSVELLRK